ncbi:hypothetical protein NLG97_g3307 [Lecanicillium saksenae]|uniref:Uncharacterized protein n=1 Tax=Lecanicillium saksenae TaxID=468837 RepID=A0ACC1QZV7_9HYPO|nr:hypothetical protein NLG97_g3307 [Lecanicillium saksenae]
MGLLYPPDCALQCYHSSWRIALELLFCLAIVAAYIPQYVKIARSSTTVGISSHYVLSHVLFSTTALFIRIANDVYYDAFNCVRNGDLKGWEAVSTLTGYLQVIVQWLCAMALLVMFLHHYDRERHQETEQNALSPEIIKKTVSTFAAVFLPVAAVFLWQNDEAWTKPGMSWGFVVYVLMLGLIMFVLKLLFTLLYPMGQFWYQFRLLRSMASPGALSIVSTALMSLSFVALAVLQLLSSWPNLYLEWKSDVGQLSLFSAWYTRLSLVLGYFAAGIVQLALFVFSWYCGWRDTMESVGPVHLD